MPAAPLGRVHCRTQSGDACVNALPAAPLIGIESKRIHPSTTMRTLARCVSRVIDRRCTGVEHEHRPWLLRIRPARMTGRYAEHPASSDREAFRIRGADKVTSCGRPTSREVGRCDCLHPRRRPATEVSRLAGSWSLPVLRARGRGRRQPQVHFVMRQWPEPASPLSSGSGCWGCSAGREGSSKRNRVQGIHW